MAERLNIFEVPILDTGDGGEENDRIDDGTLFFGFKTTHALFSCFTIGMTRYSFPIPWPWSLSAFHSFPDERCMLKLFKPWTADQLANFTGTWFYFTGGKKREMNYIIFSTTGRTKINLELLFFPCEQYKSFDTIVPPVV